VQTPNRLCAGQPGYLRIPFGYQVSGFWLDKYERQEGENPPVGLILCSKSGREEIELLKLDRDGILVAEYWTALPPRSEFEQKIHSILSEAQERPVRQTLLPPEQGALEDK
jgi:hypothetical protein